VKTQVELAAAFLIKGFLKIELSRRRGGMATLEEIAHGVVEALIHPTPEPLGVDLSSHVPAEISYLAQAVIDECTAAGVPLAAVRVAPAVGEHLAVTPTAGSLQDEGVRVEVDDSLDRRIELFRWRR
jgi:hypothetical protein